MRENWKRVELGSLGVFRNGVNFSKEKKGEGLFLINVKDLFTDGPYIDFGSLDKVDLAGIKGIEKHYVEAGDLFFSRSSVKRDGVGVVSMAPNTNHETVHCGFVIRFRTTSPDVDPLYLTYVLRSDYYRKIIIGISSGSAIINVSQDTLAKITIDLPSITYQNKVLSILSAYDRLIENNTRRIQILEEMARSLYDEWFVRFRFPSHEQTKLVDSGLGLIPDGWSIRKLPTLCSKVIDGTHDSPKPVEEGFYMVTGRHIINGFIDFSQCYLISPEEHEKVMKRSKPEKGDIIFSNIGTLGSTVLVDQDFEFSIKNVALFKPLEPIYSSFLYLYFSSPDTLEAMSRKASGTSQRFFSLKFLRDLELLVPSDEKLLTNFDEVASPLLKQRSLLHKKNQNLRKTRDLLLPKLISGEIDVESLEIESEGKAIEVEEVSEVREAIAV